MALTPITLTIESGTTFVLSLSTPVSLTNLYGRLRVKSDKHTTFLTNYATPYSNAVIFVLSELQTDSIWFKEGWYDADLLSFHATPIVQRLQKGRLIVDET